MNPRTNEADDAASAIPFRTEQLMVPKTYSTRTSGRMTAGQLQRLDGLLTQLWSEEIGVLTPASPQNACEISFAVQDMIKYVRRLHNARRSASRRGNRQRGGLSVEMLKALRYYAAEPHSAARIGQSMPTTTTSVALFSRGLIEAGSHRVTDLGRAKLVEIDAAGAEAAGVLERES